MSKTKKSPIFFACIARHVSALIIFSVALLHQLLFSSMTSKTSWRMETKTKTKEHYHAGHSGMFSSLTCTDLSTFRVKGVGAEQKRFLIPMLTLGKLSEFVAFVISELI